MAVVISGVFCIIVGLALGAGGAKVVSLGGTWYFAIVAAGFLLTGALLLMRRRAALWVYALLMLGALGWALYEVGLDWWQLAPRGSIIAPGHLPGAERVDVIVEDRRDRRQPRPRPALRWVPLGSCDTVLVTRRSYQSPALQALRAALLASAPRPAPSIA